MLKLLFSVFTNKREQYNSFTRYYMYKQLKNKLHYSDELSALSISHSEPLTKLVAPNSKIFSADYPEYNISKLDISPETFDLCVSDQVLEHVECNPQQAFDEHIKALKPNGIAIITTCFINPIHGAPNDFWRFTEEGLKLLAKENGNVEVIESGSWGNFFIWIFLRLGLYKFGVPDSQFNVFQRLATYSNPKWPIVTWIALRKEGEKN